MVNERIQAIHNSAVRLFLTQGYSRTQISHIAKAVGVSVGTIYHDFIGKEEIMHFILKCAIDPDFINHDFDRPITDELFEGLDDEIVAAFDSNAEEFSKNISDPEYTLEELVSDAFDMLSRYAAGCLFIEKNQLDCPKLAKCYRAYRQKFFDLMIGYIQKFVENGTMRPLDDPKLTSCLIIEILSWWAMDIRYTSFETWDIPIEKAKEVCIDNIVNAYKK